MGTNFSRGQFRGGLPTGAKLKKSKIRFPRNVAGIRTVVTTGRRGSG